MTEWAHEGKPPMTVGALRRALEAFPDDMPVLINGHMEGQDDQLITYAQRIFDVEPGFADTGYDINWDLTFSSRNFAEAERVVRILGCDDEPDTGTYVIHNGVAPPD